MPQISTQVELKTQLRISTQNPVTMAPRLGALMSRMSADLAVTGRSAHLLTFYLSIVVADLRGPDACLHAPWLFIIA